MTGAVRDWLILEEVSAAGLLAWFTGEAVEPGADPERLRRGHGTAVLIAVRQLEASGIDLAVLRPVSRNRTILRELDNMGYTEHDVEPSRRALDRWWERYQEARNSPDAREREVAHSGGR